MARYYLYVNSNDLNKFLVENLIFPHTNDHFGKRPISLYFNNGLVLFKKTLDTNIVCETCSDGFNIPVVLEMEIIFDKNFIKIEEEDYIIIDHVISFSNVVRIYFVGDNYSNLIVNNIFLFESLISEEKYKGDYLNLDIEKIKCIDFKTDKDVCQIIKFYSKIQAFYCARFGYLETVCFNKKRLNFKVNIDLDSFKYISDNEYSDFLDDYYKVKKKSKNKMALSLTDTTFLNDNFEDILWKLIHKKHNNFNWHAELYNMLLLYESGDFLDYLSHNDLFTSSVNDIRQFKRNECNNISFLSDYFNKLCDDRLTITIFILSRIVSLDADEAKLYINNFFENSEYEKELLSMYGLMKGMKSITYYLKRNPSILLFAYNNTVKYFDCAVFVPSEYAEYYKNRNYETECIMKYGFDLKIFDEKRELDYVNDKIKSVISDLVNVDSKCISNKIISKINNKKLHELFLMYKRGDMNERV